MPKRKAPQRRAGDLKEYLAAVGARAAEYAHVYQAFLPNKDKDDREFDVGRWEDEALHLQAELFEGASSNAVRGAWRRRPASEGPAEIQLETTHVVESFVREEDWTLDAIRRATEFLKRFGRATNQATVAFSLDGELRYIDLTEA